MSVDPIAIESQSLATGQARQSITFFRRIAISILVGAVSTGLVLMVLSRWSGSWENLSLFLQGVPFAVKTVVERETDVAAADLSGKVMIRNLTWQPIQLDGVQAACACVVTRDDVPMRIDAQSQKNVRFALHTAGRPAEFDQSVILYIRVASRTYPVTVRFRQTL